MPNYTVEALVIRRRNFSERDRIFTLLTPNRGKIRAVAKSVRRPGSRMAGHLEPFSHSKVFLAEGRNLDIITQTSALSGAPDFQLNLDRMSQAFYAAELVDALTHEGEENYALFKIVHKTFLDLARRDLDPLLAIAWFEYALVCEMGYQPQSDELAGLLLHSPADSSVPQVMPKRAATDPGQLAACFNQFDAQTPMEEVRGLFEPVAEEVCVITRRLVQRLCEQNLKSTQFMSVVRQLSAPVLS